MRRYQLRIFNFLSFQPRLKRKQMLTFWAFAGKLLNFQKRVAAMLHFLAASPPVKGFQLGFLISFAAVDIHDFYVGDAERVSQRRRIENRWIAGQPNTSSNARRGCALGQRNGIGHWPIRL
ncbi:MAG TPA: hypothetical protein VH206_08285 [Xanthobacteraceae bacterium]|jgi:hypothetical protein|nr:hypothetical protein [Xanthobacteraceae bacterium]